MPAIAPVVLPDGQATPVNRTFEPYTAQYASTPAEFWEKSAGSVNGYRRLLVLTRRSNKQTATSGATNISVRLVTPVLETVSGTSSSGYAPAAAVAYNVLFNCDFVLPDRCTAQDRKDILAYAKAALANALVTACVQNVETIY